MKKLTAMLLSVVMTFGLAACGTMDTNNEQNEGIIEDSEIQADTQEETPVSLSIEHALGTTEVPYAPEHICVLDSNAMDFIHALNLGEYVASVQSPRGIPSYLEEYYNSDSIILLDRMEADERGNESGETTDPYEGYYIIDADLIIGSADTVDEELYAVLSQIAPTVVTNFAIDHEDGMYAGVKANARMIASIWGVEEKLDELLLEYDAIYQKLDVALDGVSVVILNSSMEHNNRIWTVYNDEDESRKAERERNGRMLVDMGAIVYSNDVTEEVKEASVFQRGTEADVQSGRNQVVASWIEDMTPDYVLITEVSTEFASLEEAEAGGYAIEALTGLTAYREGRLFMLSNGIRNGHSGLYGTFMHLNELAGIFLN